MLSGVIAGHPTWAGVRWDVANIRLWRVFSDGFFVFDANHVIGIACGNKDFTFLCMMLRMGCRSRDFFFEKSSYKDLDGFFALEVH